MASALDGMLRDSRSTAAIIDGIPRFVTDDFADSFGFQWNRFEVRRQQEDEETFVVKTGVPLHQIKGLRILDAGCGGGRYTRVVAEHGAELVVGVDRSRAVDKARELTSHLQNVALLQADLTELPLAAGWFDLVFSIGVLHHAPDPAEAFRGIARLVKPGGCLSIWVYRKNWWLQELVNDFSRGVSRRVPRSSLVSACQWGAILGGVPLMASLLSKIVNFSTHPDYAIRVCDTFDWYSPRYQYHHTLAEVQQWFAQAEFTEIRELPPAKSGRMYRALVKGGLVPGSGVNVAGLRRPV